MRDRSVSPSVSSTLPIAVLAIMCAATSGRAAPELPPPWAAKTLTLELKQADVANIYHALSTLAGAPVRVDSCVKKKKIDLKLENAPLSVVLDVLALKLGVLHVVEGDVLVARCDGAGALPVIELAPAPPAQALSDEQALQTRVTLVFKKGDPQRAFQAIADATGAKLHVTRIKPIAAGEKLFAGTIEIELHNVSAQTAILALSETLNLGIQPNIVDGELLVLADVKQ